MQWIWTMGYAVILSSCTRRLRLRWTTTKGATWKVHLLLFKLTFDQLVHQVTKIIPQLASLTFLTHSNQTLPPLGFKQMINADSQISNYDLRFKWVLLVWWTPLWLLGEIKIQSIFFLSLLKTTTTCFWLNSQLFLVLQPGTQKKKKKNHYHVWYKKVIWGPSIVGKGGLKTINK